VAAWECFNCGIIRLSKKKKEREWHSVRAQFISISRVRITSGDNYRERGLVNRIASRAQYFLACRGRFKSFRRAMNARASKCLRASRFARGHAALFAYAYCDRPDSFFFAGHSFLSRALFFLLSLFYFAAYPYARPSDNQFSVARESAIGRRTCS